MRAISLLFHDVFINDPDESGFVSAAANRYKLTVADFDAQLDGVAAARAELPILANALEHHLPKRLNGVSYVYRNARTAFLTLSVALGTGQRC